MTRINVGIAPRKLTDQHLLAEHREIKRLCAMFCQFKNFDSIPSKFTLGTGHMKFFMDKFRYTFYRYQRLYNECMTRKFAVEYYGENWAAIPFEEEMWTPTNEDRKLIIDRISERILESNQKPRYCGMIISKIDAINLLKSN